MADSIVDGTNIDVNVFQISDPKPHASGAKVSNLINKNFKESLTISTPLMLTWGAQEGKDTAGNPTGKWSMSLQFPTAEYSNPDTEAFLKSMRDTDAAIKKVAFDNSLKWFGKEIKSEETVNDKFNEMLKHPKKEKGGVIPDTSRPPTLNIKIPQWKGVWKPEIYDEDGEPLYINGKVNTHLSPLEFLKPKTHVICLLQCGGLWFVNGKVSITWNLMQAIIQKPKATIGGSCFLKPKDSDRERLKSLPPPEDDIDPNGVPTTVVEDSDDEHEAIESVVARCTVSHAPVPAPAPAPAPVDEQNPVTEEVKPKKKIVRKKAE
jgi:hypothetical protein